MSAATNDEFNWLADEDVVVGRQRAIAVYENDKGDVVIRQEKRCCNDEHDPCIVLPLKSAKAVADAIMCFVEASWDPPRDDASPAALRQRRYRERHRQAKSNGVGNTEGQQ